MRSVPIMTGVVLATSVMCAAQTSSVATIHQLDGTRITTAEAEAFARETLAASHVTGAQLAVVDRGKLVWSAAFGERRRDPSLPMDTGTTLWAASITKSVFATYVMQLVEQGEFNLDTPVARLLPKPLDQYPDYKEKAASLVHDPLWPTVTPRMLLSHSSGLANFAWLEKDSRMRLRFKPGTDFLYSGEGINLVQFVIEQQKGKPLDQLMQEAIFAPLRMKQTGLIYREEFGADVADRYDATGKFISKTQRFPARGAGSMTTSAEDLSQFVAALFAGKLLKPTTQAEMFKPVITLHALHEFPLAANEGDSAEATAAGLSYGVGWGLLLHTKYGPAFFKEGHGDGAQNYILCFERRRACMILLTNSDNGELAFRPLLEKIFGDTVTPWEWEGYTPEHIDASRRVQ
jgi:CubicO group peptidase (beta-lactamase class C family)